jgi:hypothetical protein
LLSALSSQFPGKDEVECCLQSLFRELNHKVNLKTFTDKSWDQKNRYVVSQKAIVTQVNVAYDEENSTILKLNELDYFRMNLMVTKID